MVVTQQEGVRGRTQQVTMRGINDITSELAPLYRDTSYPAPEFRRQLTTALGWSESAEREDKQHQSDVSSDVKEKAVKSAGEHHELAIKALDNAIALLVETTKTLPEKQSAYYDHLIGNAIRAIGAMSEYEKARMNEISRNEWMRKANRN